MHGRQGAAMTSWLNVSDAPMALMSGLTVLAVWGFLLYGIFHKGCGCRCFSAGMAYVWCDKHRPPCTEESDTRPWAVGEEL